MTRPSTRIRASALTTALVWGGVTAALAGCDDEFSKPSVIANLRVVAVQASLPDAEIGDDVTLDALLLQPDPTAPIERLWAACVITPGAQTALGCVMPEGGGMPPSCSAQPEAPFCLIGSDAQVSYRIPARALLGRAQGERGQVVITLVAAATADGGALACAASLANPDDAAENCRVTVKRLNVRPPADPQAANKNPGLTSFTLDGDELQVTLADDAIEPTPGGTEQLYYSWYVTGGELENFRTDAMRADGHVNVWTKPTEPGTYQAAVVVHDGRGGSSWLTTELVVP